MEDEDQYKQALKDYYKQKVDWHKKYTPIAAKHFNNTCQKCYKSANEKNGVIHHYQYTGNDYITSLEKLLERKAVDWLCKECHKREHIAYCPEEVNYKINHSGYCIICQNFEFHIWFNVQFGYKPHVGIENLPFCKKCIKKLLKYNVLQKVKKSLFGSPLYTCIEKGDWENNPDPIAKEIIKLVKSRVVSGKYGNPDTNDEEKGIQANLFDI